MGVGRHRLLLVLILASAAARAEAQIDGMHLGPVAFGDCRLAVDPASEEGRAGLGVAACVRARAGAEATFVAGTPAENAWIRYAHADGSLHYGEWLSLHARGDLRDRIPLGEEVSGSRYRDTDAALVRFGNPALHRYRLTAGKARLPFGIDDAQVVEHYRAFEDRRFWSSPEHAAWVTLDDRETLQLDFGVATDDWKAKDDDDEADGAATAADGVVEDGAGESGATGEDDGSGANPSDLVARAFAARLSLDFSALDGSRLLFSGYGENTGVRKMGLGFVTVSRKDDLTEFEFVRRLTRPGNEGAPFSQLIRIGYVSAFRSDTRWVVQFDDERHRHRMGTIGQDALAAGHLLFRFAVTYFKSESGDDVRRWYLTSGMEARL
jgi:hypothetical protein